MLGFYVNELKNSISFPGKEEFLEKVSSFNSLRNDAIHKMRKNNLELVAEHIRTAKSTFDEIFELYDQIQDYFRVTFHGFQKDVFLDYDDPDAN